MSWMRLIMMRLVRSELLMSDTDELDNPAGSGSIVG